MLITVLLADGMGDVWPPELDPVSDIARVAGVADVVVTESMALMGMARLARR
ncbi:hypothetical protein LQG66_13230 [Bradyrhizobium ontarionense]|uniref:Metalloenzyme domain-containing protein n=1 Tax=Bradyrhizobium ontarionense TaxID=2898149 RepID=A0ABY3RJE0_9BRAD|nr:hypothetical protein [Bradyrhizobium sp. A19]UFZ07202.1 hypothetical protein LQG66_13230 [Bradyrhizobium sp. A19]